MSVSIHLPASPLAVMLEANSCAASRAETAPPLANRARRSSGADASTSSGDTSGRSIACWIFVTSEAIVLLEVSSVLACSSHTLDGRDARLAGSRRRNCSGCAQKRSRAVEDANRQTRSASVAANKGVPSTRRCSCADVTGQNSRHRDSLRQRGAAVDGCSSSGLGRASKAAASSLIWSFARSMASPQSPKSRQRSWSARETAAVASDASEGASAAGKLTGIARLDAFAREMPRSF